MIGTLVSKEPKLTKKEDKYYTVKTDIVVEGEEFKVSFNAFNNNDDKHADIVSLLAEGVRIKVEVEKDGKYWNLKSIEPVGPAQEAPTTTPTTAPTTATAVVAASPGGTEAFNDREARKQVSINALSIYSSTVKGAGIQVAEIDNVMAECARVGKKLYNGDYDDNVIPF